MITKETCQSLRNDLNSAFAEISKKYGMTIDVKNMSYSPNSITFKTECYEVGKEAIGDPLAEYKAKWDINTRHRRFNDQFGKQIMLRGTNFKVIGYNSRKPKNCFTIMSDDGKIYICSAEAAKIEVY